MQRKTVLSRLVRAAAGVRTRSAAVNVRTHESMQAAQRAAQQEAFVIPALTRAYSSTPLRAGNAAFRDTLTGRKQSSTGTGGGAGALAEGSGGTGEETGGFFRDQTLGSGAGAGTLAEGSGGTDEDTGGFLRNPILATAEGQEGDIEIDRPSSSSSSSIFGGGRVQEQQRVQGRGGDRAAEPVTRSQSVEQEEQDLKKTAPSPQSSADDVDETTFRGASSELFDDVADAVQGAMMASNNQQGEADFLRLSRRPDSITIDLGPQGGQVVMERDVHGRRLTLRTTSGTFSYAFNPVTRVWASESHGQDIRADLTRDLVAARKGAPQF